jgi:hypothetical protein
VLAGLSRKAVPDLCFHVRVIGENASADSFPPIPAQNSAEVPDPSPFSRMHLVWLIVQSYLMAEQDDVSPFGGGPSDACPEALPIKLNRRFQGANRKR